ncbi:MAG TPA: hypothetical protein VFE65_34075 [Pseudonocardia sp.]|jgi:hypothetical protein|nr:hypothetical protein [Pseudonocardia sp.]
MRADKIEEVVARIPRIPRQRNRSSLERAAQKIERWLDTQDPDLLDDVDELWRVSDLALAGAGDDEIDAAVCKARQRGWQWNPIAVLLDESVEQTQERVSAAS